MIRIILTLTLFAAALFSRGAESPYGACAHLNRWEFPQMPQELRMMKDAGIGFVRTDLDWNQVEKNPGQWNFTQWDALVKQAGENKIAVLPILGGFQPKWGSPLVKHRDKWENYLTTVVNRYKEQVRYWEVVNEPDLGEFSGKEAEYGRFLTESARIIRRAVPESVVVMGGLAGPERMEKVMEHAGPDGFDIANIHLYYWQDVPEASLAHDLLKLRQAMKRRGAGDKPLWLTETGYSTAPPADFTAIMAAALKELELDAPALPVVFLQDSDYHYYTGGPNLNPQSFFAAGRNIQQIPLTGLSQLDARRFPLLMLPAGESFPVRFLDALTGYLNRGGTVICPGGGIPFYFDRVRLEDGSIEKRGAPERVYKALHLDWDAWWKTPGAPRGTRLLTSGPGFQFALADLPSCSRYLSGNNLKEGDRLIPLVNAHDKEGKYTAPVAAIYRFNSDLKGNFIVFTCTDSSHRTSPEQQAKLLPRSFLIAFHAGVEKAFCYSFRSQEQYFPKSREGHFGLLRQNMEPKPAYRAYAALTEMYPPGSKKLEIFRRNGAYLATWEKPGGTPVLAAWSAMLPVPLSLPVTGRPAIARNHLGETVDVRQNGSQLELTADTGIVYLEGIRLSSETK